jgi:2-hydroxychromene-2-carboxylate isomerase
LLAARVACRYHDEEWLPEFVRRVYLASFAHDRNIAERTEIAAILLQLDLPVDLLDEAESPESKARLRAQTDRATTLGIFGAPSFVIGTELFWGNDRLEAAVAWGRRHEAMGPMTSPRAYEG